MINKHKDATSQTAQNIAKKKIADLKAGTTLDDEIDLLLFEMLNYPVYCGKGYSHIKFDDFTAKMGLNEYDVLHPLEYYGLLDGDRKWSPDVLSTGLILNVSYSGIDAINNETRHYYYDLCSPHGHMFFQVFFSLLKIWNWESVQKTDPTVNN